MWTRKELKSRAKLSMRPNYWKTVLVALIMTVLVGGGTGATGGFSGAAQGISSVVVTQQTAYSDGEDNDQSVYYVEDEDAQKDAHGSEIIGGADEATEIYADDNEMYDSNSNIAAAIVFVVIFAVIFLLIMVIAILVSVFIMNPLNVGANRFFIRNLHEKGEIRELAYAFDNGYMNTVKVMFFMDLYTFLWTLLLIIPGIVKSYEYRMIPYLLAKNPELTREEAFAKSKEMMRGNKWRAFVLDLSFIPWQLLSLITFGIVGMFFVNPYVFETNAALFEALDTDNNAYDTENYALDAETNASNTENYALDTESNASGTE